MLESCTPPPARSQPQHPADLRVEVTLDGGLHHDRQAVELTKKVRIRQIDKSLKFFGLFDVD